jgi:hypothetical protein
MTSHPIIAWFGQLGHLGQPAPEFLADERPTLDHWLTHSQALPTFVGACPVARRYLQLLGPLAWAQLPPRQAHPNGNPEPLPYGPFAAACLIKLDQQLPSMGALRQYLVDHPALVWLCGFPLVPARNTYGFNIEASLPTPRHLTRLLRQMPNAIPQALLDSSIVCLQAELAATTTCLGETVALDTKHILAWVKENNPKQYVADRYDKTQQPPGDPDCRLGCKRRHNQTDGKLDQPPAHAPTNASASPSTPTTEGLPARHAQIGEFYWGYASGIVAVKAPDWGEFVLAELTQTFDRGDVICFFPLMAQVERRLGRKPSYGALDAAFDAHYVYDYFHEAGGFAAVPLAQRGKTDRTFDPAGLPICPAGLAMPLKDKFWCRSTAVEHERGRYACPLQHPTRTADACPVADEHWTKDGCLVTMPTSAGARIRLQLDRNAASYKAIYAQRTATERLFSQALELGIERPKLRNGAAVANLNTLIYVLLNLRTLQRIRQRLQAHSATEPHDFQP